MRQLLPTTQRLRHLRQQGRQIVNFHTCRTILSLAILVFFNFSLQAQSAAELRAQANKSQGEDKLDLLIELSSKLANDLDTSAIAISDEGLQIAKQLHQPDLYVKALNQKANVLTELSLQERAFEVIAIAESINSTDVSNLSKAETIFQKALAHHYAADYDLADFYFRKAKSIAARENASKMLADINAEHANNYRYKGDYDQATALNYEALRYFESVGDSSEIMQTKASIGIVHFVNGETDAALDLFLLNKDYLERQKDSSKLGFAYTLLGLGYFQKRDYDLSERYSRISVDIRQQRNDIRGLGESFNNLALAYMGKGEWEKAGDVLELSLNNLNKSKDRREVPVILGNIADTKMRLGKMEEAMAYYQDAEKQASEMGLKPTHAVVIRKVCRLYAKQGNFEKAYEKLQEYSDLQSALMTEEKAKIMNQLRIEYDSEEQARKIDLLEQDKAFEKKKQYYIGIGLGLVVIILVLVIYMQFVLRRRTKLLYNQELVIMQGREQLTEAELRNARNELDYHKNMLGTYMENILRKNDLIENLEQQVKTIHVEGEEAEEEKELRLKELLAMKILTEDDWEIFKSHFEHVHAGLLAKLKNDYPAMTVGESRLFILLKLQLGTKEISNILGVSPESVKKNRYRLRKKLELDEGIKLEDFVDSI